MIIIKEVPNIISTKDLSYLEDAMNWNHAMCKKINLYENMVSDKEIKKFIESVKRMCKEHFNELLNVFE